MGSRLTFYLLYFPYYLSHIYRISYYTTLKSRWLSLCRPFPSRGWRLGVGRETGERGGGVCPFLCRIEGNNLKKKSICA